MLQIGKFSGCLSQKKNQYTNSKNSHAFHINILDKKYWKNVSLRISVLVQTGISNELFFFLSAKTQNHKYV